MAGFRPFWFILLLPIVNPHWSFGSDAVSIKCAFDRPGEALTCKLRNLLEEDILFLASSFSLEGPLGEDGYLYFFVGGERKENTIEFGRLEIQQTLRGPIQLEPIVHINTDDLSHLCRLKSGSSVSIMIDLSEAYSSFNQEGPWLLRPKVVAVPVGRVLSLIDSAVLGEACTARLRSAISSTATCADATRLGTRPPRADFRFTDDGCLTVLSAEFLHFFANEVPVPERRSQP